MKSDSSTAMVSTKRVPGPRGKLLLGSLKEFTGDALGFLSESVQQYGDVVRFRFGHVTAFLLNRPEYVEHVLSNESRRFNKNTRSVAKVRATCGNSLLSTDGKPWLRHRRLIQPVFQPQRVTEFVPIIDAATEEMLQDWSTKANRQEDVDIVSEMTCLTLNIAAQVFFTSDIRDQTAIIEESLAVILKDTWRRLESPIDWSVISPRLHRREFRLALRGIDQLVYHIIEQRRSGQTAGDDLLVRLLRAHGEGDARFSDLELRDAVVTLLLAGHETTANALATSFCFASVER